MFCIKCAGSGRILGNGMMVEECSNCCGSGQLFTPKEEKVKIDKRGSSYKKAIKEIMELSPETSKEDAEKIFEETYDKI